MAMNGGQLSYPPYCLTSLDISPLRREVQSKKMRKEEEDSDDEKLFQAMSENTDVFAAGVVNGSVSCSSSMEGVGEA